MGLGPTPLNYFDVTSNNVGSRCEANTSGNQAKGGVERQTGNGG